MIRTSAAALAALLASTSLPSIAMAQAAPPSSSATAAFAMTDATDPYLWLEEVEGERAMQWVREHNEKSLGTLQADARYEPLHQQALEIVQARDRIPGVGFNRDGSLSNFWQDAQHVRGVWRQTTVDSYRTPSPEWETICLLYTSPSPRDRG